MQIDLQEIDVRLGFLLNILRMNGENLTKFCLHMNNYKIYIGIFCTIFANQELLPFEP